MNRTERPTRLQNRLLLLVGMGFGLLACVAHFGGDANDTPPQGWWAQRGPVVPHDTFPRDCSLCHTGDDWHTIREDFSYDHQAETGVELVGAHAVAECLRCHNDRGPVSVFARRGCAGCHEDVHLGQLGADCSTCHDERDWRPSAEIASHERTRFPLVGAHAAVACWRCHPGSEVGIFTPVDTECLTCHAADLARATDPDHSGFAFVEECDRCHIPTTWGGAGFIHGWRLTGAHRGLDCAECHGGGVFAGTPTDCYSCHTTDYDGASDPDHVAGGFPTDCAACHNTNTWFGANFDHDFPITSGAHAGFDCTDCHLNTSNYSDFSCTHCHDHRQSEMDDKHSEEQDYVWESGACYSCHPDGDS